MNCPVTDKPWFHCTKNNKGRITGQSWQVCHCTTKTESGSVFLGHYPQVKMD